MPDPHPIPTPTVHLKQFGACERQLQNIADLIGRQEAIETVLEALCIWAGPAPWPAQLAFYLLSEGGWRLAAQGDLNVSAADRLEGVRPARISDALSRWTTALPPSKGLPLPDGWARHLFSEMGELVGLLIHFADGPMEPCGAFAARLESVCRLAVLAVEQRNLLQELRYKADHDELTGLHNRSYYERALDWALREASYTGARIALLHAGLDRFRLVNDVLGHATGNELLRETGRRFQAQLPPQHILARIGGDEFAVILPAGSGFEEAEQVARRLLESLSTPVELDGHEVFVSASIGLACAAPPVRKAELEREAYVALYHAKHNGKARAVRYLPSMSSTPPERLELEKCLRFAIERHELRLFYQPQVELATGRMQGAEVLLRWQPEGAGIVVPGVFIPILEETGQVVEVGRWVLREACRQGREWLDREGREIRLGVNVSAIQFGQGDLLSDVETALADSGFPPHLLELELTESVLVSEFDKVVATLRAIHARGVNVALDDFGTGQSSLSYLQRLPFQRLKIDQSFVRPIREGEDLPPLAEGIIRLAGSLGMTTVAEGIETGWQAWLLRAGGCQEGQGYLFARPIPPDEFIRLPRVMEVPAPAVDMVRTLQWR
jgi:diguanylate cyclase (GGDEF)-like protein